MGPFDRFNDRAKRVLALAQDEAIRFNHNYIGPEHLLLGLVREGEGVAARTLQTLGAELSKVRKALEFQVGRGESSIPANEITLTPSTKKVIELAVDEARRLGHSQVGTEHLLLGIVRESGTVAHTVLDSLGVNLEKVRHQVIATLGQTGGAMSGAPPQVARELFDAQGKKRDWYCEDVLSGKLQVKVVWQDDRVLAIHHPYPEAPIHAVVIPKRHVTSLLAPELLDGALLLSMTQGVQESAKLLGLSESGFQLRANAIAPGVTPHVHWHIVGPGMPPPRGYPWPGEPTTAAPASSARGRTGGPLNRFDDAAKRVLALAQEEAIRLNHNYIGTEHLLAGLVCHESGIAAQALDELNVELSKVRTALEFIIGRGDTATTPSDITLSPRAKKILELAVDEADKLGHASVGPAHLLLGLVREGQGIASGILESLGVSLQSTREKVLEIMARGR